MAEDFWNKDTYNTMSEQIKTRLIKECRRQEESCLYTSTTLLVWLRRAKFWRRVWIVVPIVCGGIASWSILDKPDSYLLMWATAIAGLVAGIIPAAREALDLEIEISEIARHAALFKSLQDRFRLAASVGEFRDPAELEKETKLLMSDLDEARAASVTPPEWCFKAAQNKIRSGDYDFAIDEDKQE